MRWTNNNVLFVGPELDDRGIPYHALRVLAHLARRWGRTAAKNPGVRSIAKFCRMKPHTVEKALRALENGRIIRIHRSAGKVSRYEPMIDYKKLLYVDRRIDDAKLTPVQFRVLMYVSRLADAGGFFFVSVRKFAKVCAMDRNTIRAALKELEQLEYYGPYDDRKNPMHFLELSELFSHEEKRTAETPPVTKRDNTPGENGAHPLVKMDNGGGGKGTTKESPLKNPLLRNSIEESPAAADKPPLPTTAAAAFSVSSEERKPKNPEDPAPSCFVDPGFIEEQQKVFKNLDVAKAFKAFKKERGPTGGGKYFRTKFVEWLLKARKQPPKAKVLQTD